MTKEHVAYVDGELHITHRKGVASVSPSSILQLNTCLLSRFIPDFCDTFDEFHILIQAQQFWLIGPLIHGAIPAIDALTRAHPEIPRWEMHLHKLPWRLRAPSCLGLRLFLTPGWAVFRSRHCQRTPNSITARCPSLICTGQNTIKARSGCAACTLHATSTLAPPQKKIPLQAGFSTLSRQTCRAQAHTANRFFKCAS